MIIYTGFHKIFECCLISDKLRSVLHFKLLLFKCAKRQFGVFYRKSVYVLLYPYMISMLQKLLIWTFL